MIGELSHVTLLVADLDEALAYYTDVLGFQKRDVHESIALVSQPKRSAFL